MQVLGNYKLYLEGEDITDDIIDDCISIELEDNIGLESDSLSIRLNNRTLNYINAFRQGNEIELELYDINNNILKSGKFQIDSVSGSIGAQHIHTINALSANSIDQALTRQTNYSRKRVFLDVLLSDISKKIGYNLVYRFYNNTVPWKIQLKNVMHSEETIGSILKNYADLFKCIIKVHDNKIIFSDKKSFKNDIVSKEINPIIDSIDSFSYSMLSKPYSEIETKYYDPKTGREIKDKRKGASKLVNGELKKYITKISDINMAQAIAKSIDNYDQVAISFETIGSINYIAGNVIEIKELFDFSGKYLIKKSNHSINQYGWNVSVDAVNLF